MRAKNANKKTPAKKNLKTKKKTPAVKKVSPNKQKSIKRMINQWNSIERQNLSLSEQNHLSPGPSKQQTPKRRKFNRRSQNNNKQKANEKSRQIIRRSRDFLNNFNRSGMKRRTLTNDSDDCIIIENSNQNIVICLDDDSMQAPEKKVLNDTLEDGEIRSQIEANVEETLEEGEIRSEVESLLDSILDEAIPNNLSTISIGDNTVVDPNTTPNNNNQNKPNSNMEVSFYEDFKAGFNSNHVVPLYDPISDDSFVTLGDRTLKPANISLDKTLTPNKSITPKNAKKRLNKSSADDSVIFCGEVIDLDLVPTKRAKTSEDFIQLPRCYPAPRRRLPQINPWAQFVNLPKPSPTKKQKQQQQQQKQQQPQQPSSSSAPPKPDVPKEKRMVVIDGSNVAFHHSNNKEFSVKGISIAVEYFKSRGHEVKVIVPQFRMKKYLSTDQNALETLQQQGIVILTPSKNLPGQCSSSYDDRFILDVADNFDAAIISNDNYKDLLDEKPSWKNLIQSRVVGYTWCNDMLFLPQDPYGRFGPKLDDILLREIQPKAPKV